MDKKYTIGVTIHIYGSDLDPDIITSTLDTIPSSSNRKGDKLGREKKYTAKTGHWSLKPTLESQNMSDNIIDLMSMIKNQDVRIVDLPGVDEDGCVDIFMARVIKDDERGGDCEFMLTPAALAALAKSGLSLSVTTCIISNIRHPPPDD